MTTTTTAPTPGEFCAALRAAGIDADLAVFGGPGYPAVPFGILADGRGWMLTGEDGCFTGPEDGPMDEPLYLVLYASEAENAASEGGPGSEFCEPAAFLRGTCTAAQAAAAIRAADDGDYSAFDPATTKGPLGRCPFPPPLELLRTTQGTPMFGPEVRAYLRALRYARPETWAAWRTATCPECGSDPQGDGLVPVDDTCHVLLGGAVVLGCEGYRVVSPAALGQDAPDWEDWRGWNEGAAYINLEPAAPGEPGDFYQVTLFGALIGGRAGSYPEALAALREAVAESAADPERLPVYYMSHRTGLIVEFPVPLPEVAADWDRPARPEDAAWFASLGGHIGVEALCLLCGETCNPHGPDDLVHVQTEAGQECGGPLVPLGAWGTPPPAEARPVPARPVVTPPAPAGALTEVYFAAIRQAVERELGGGTTWAEIAGLDLAGLCARNQDALIDDLYERHPDDEPHRAEMAALIRTYDDLLGTRRAGTLPADLLP